jgi:aryl-alcohol dehydrogenase-like predicted oxidoreductase
MTQRCANLGLGLIAIGREWGLVKQEVPSEEEAQDLLHTAIRLGIRFFDTAPAYGFSEARFGRFLKSLDSELSANVFVATKCGLHWDFERGMDYADHSYDALCRSIDQSQARLQRIDLLQLHRASLTTIASGDVKSAFRYAQSLGIRNFGVSVSDVPAAKLALADALFTYVQLPFNVGHPSTQEAIELTASAGRQVIVNRPFGMGQLLYNAQAPKSDDPKIAAYSFILRQKFSGVVLTGTKSPIHLRQNVAAFEEAVGVHGYVLRERRTE